MIELIVSVPEYAQDTPNQMIWTWIQEQFPSKDGICCYKHPALMTPPAIFPDLTLVTKTHFPVIVRCIPASLDDIQEVDEETWKINNNEIDSPIKQADDLTVALLGKFNKDREIRYRLNPFFVIAFPLISKTEFENKFPDTLTDQKIIWSDGNISPLIQQLDTPLNDLEWRHVESIIQGISVLTKGSGTITNDVNTLGDTIRQIDKIIAILDKQQAKAALQIAPGPQRIRGLAGTGKTILLAMKAANIHYRYPDKLILFTFATQSLYNQIKYLIAKFYRANSDVAPDWNYLHIRHAWGGANKPGVYFDTCNRTGIRPLTFVDAKFLNRNNPFQLCCKQVLHNSLSKPLIPEYDFIMVDEAQDFPQEFFQILYKISKPEHKIYWAYDDLQSLFATEVPTPEDLFGNDESGNPLVTLSGDTYPGGIEKDIILNRSYRCPQEVLMLAHALGLGLYRQNGPPVQMLTTPESWDALGYVIEEGELVTGSSVVIFRPVENSPNPITSLYKGQPVVLAKEFDNRENEIKWIADSILNDIQVEKVLPEHIVVICLDAPKMRQKLLPLQKQLTELNILSTIPGITDSSDSFAEPGRVTLSTVFRAKGNESYIIYIFSFDAIYDYVEEIINRNRAFTAISRSKAWVRITGIGEGMVIAKKEIDKILADQPRFKFTYPHPESIIRNLSAETDLRRRGYRKIENNVKTILSAEQREYIKALLKKRPDLIQNLESLVEEVKKGEDK